MSGRRAAAAAAAVLVGIGIWQIGGAAVIHAKAILAQHLLRAAWQRTLAGERRVRPWPWADTWPVARLIAPVHGVDLIVLAGASGASLAFGPGHLDGTPPPGAPGNSVIGGHRDTSLGFLRGLAVGDRLEVERPDGRRVAYRVSDALIVDARKPWMAPARDAPALVLVTCYPFDAIVPGGPQRYLVLAEGKVL